MALLKESDRAVVVRSLSSSAATKGPTAPTLPGIPSVEEEET